MSQKCIISMKVCINHGPMGGGVSRTTRTLKEEFHLYQHLWRVVVGWRDGGTAVEGEGWQCIVGRLGLVGGGKATIREAEAAMKVRERE